MSAMKSTFSRVSETLVRPRQTLVRLANGDDGDVTDVVIVMVLVRLALQAGHVARQLWTAADAPSVALRRIADALYRGIRADVMVLGGAVVVSIVVVRFVIRAKAPMRGVATAVAYAGVFVLVIESLGGIASYLGANGWWLPHTPIDSPWAVVVKNQVDVGRFLTKIAIVYTIPLIVLADFWRAMWVSTRAARDVTVVDAPSTVAPPMVAPSAERAPAQSIDGDVANSDDARSVDKKDLRARAGRALTMAISVALLGTASFHVVDNRDRIRPLLTGDRAPWFRLPVLTTTNDGRVVATAAKTIALKDLRGSVVVLDFWASWCVPCRRMLPVMNTLSETYKSDGLVVVGVNREPENLTAAHTASQELGLTFQSVVDPASGSGRSYGDVVGLQSIPTTLLIDREGILRHVHVGMMEPDTLEQEIQTLLRR